MVAPDIVGFGYTERPDGAEYGKELWLKHLLGFMDALSLTKVNVVGNSFGGALALLLATRHPERVNKLVLMGSVGVSFALTEGLNAVWGYEPSVANMKKLLGVFAYNRDYVNDDLAELRYQASIRPGYQETFSQMFPVPRQAGVDALTIDENAIAAIKHQTLIIHGHEDAVIPRANSDKLLELIPNAELHVFRQCGHWVQIEKSARFNEIVSQFLKS